jgi:outer membrane protein TolC
MPKNFCGSRKIWGWFGGLSIICLWVSGALAQTPQVLGLEQLIHLALENSPELKQATQSIAAAISDVDQARAARWAQVDVTAVAGIVGNAKKPLVVVSTQPEADGSLRGRIEEDNSNGYGPFGRLEFTISQPLYTFGKIAHRQEAATETVAAQRVAKEKTRGEVILKVKQLYFALILAQQGQEAAANVEAFVADARQRIKRLLAAGSPNVDDGDLYRLEAYAAETKRFKGRAQSGSALTYFTLKQVIGLTPQQEFVLDTRELPRDTRALGEQQEYIQQAMRLRPEFEQLDKGLEARHSLVEAAKADLYPSLFATAIGSFAGAPGRERLDELSVGDDFNHTRAGLVLGARWHFDLGILQGKIRRAQADYQRLVHTKELATMNIPIEVVKFYQEAQENLTAFQALEQAVTASRKWVVVAFSNFDIGLGQARDIFMAIERYGKNRGDYLEALLKYHLALANLSYAIGEYRTTSE